MGSTSKWSLGGTCITSGGEIIQPKTLSEADSKTTPLESSLGECSCDQIIFVDHSC